MRRLGMVLLAILFLFMVFAGPAAPKSEAVVVSTVVIGAVIAAMAAAGIGLTVSGMTSAQLQDWVSGKLNDWTTSIGGTVQDHIDNNLITVTARGLLSIGTAAAQGISNFISWLQTDMTLIDNSQTVVIQGTTSAISLTTNYQYILTNSFNYEVKTNGYIPMYVASVDTGSYSGPLVICNSFKEHATFYRTWNDGGNPQTLDVSTSESDNVTGLYHSGRSNWSITQITTSETIIYSSIREALDAVKAAIDAGQLTSPDKLKVETQVITIPTIANGDKWFLDVGADPGVTVDTVTDGVIADTIDGSLTVSGEVAEEEPEFVVNEPIGVSGLTEIFPFCIPFDVYALLSCLSAEPQTPVFTVRFVIPGVINQEFTIDLSPFSTIAQIVRTMELIAFAIGLALVTRERFLRS